MWEKVRTWHCPHSSRGNWPCYLGLVFSEKPPRHFSLPEPPRKSIYIMVTYYKVCGNWLQQPQKQMNTKKGWGEYRTAELRQEIRKEKNHLHLMSWLVFLLFSNTKRARRLFILCAPWPTQLLGQRGPEKIFARHRSVDRSRLLTSAPVDQP